MHRSRLTAVLIDVDEEQFEEGVAFWSSALGAAPKRAEGSRYVALPGLRGGLDWMVQAVRPGERAFHVDFETDDVAAEVRRLEKLGAKRKRFVRDKWWVMIAPTGHEFCVVPVQTDDWPAGATNWDE